MDNKRTDLRKVSPEELQKIKIRAMQLRDEGISNKEVAQVLSLDPSVLSRWYSEYVKNYRQPSCVTKKGRKKGTQKKLTDYQESVIIDMLVESTELLDKELIKKKVDEKYNMKIPISTVGDYLRKWGVSTNLINNFKDDFIKKVTKKRYDLVEQNIKKKNGIIIWIEVLEYEVEFNKTESLNMKIITTLIAKNKLVFKLYRNQIQANDLIDFINQTAKLFTKNPYVIYNTKNCEFYKEVNSFPYGNKVKIVKY